MKMLLRASALSGLLLACTAASGPGDVGPCKPHYLCSVSVSVMGGSGALLGRGVTGETGQARIKIVETKGDQSPEEAIVLDGAAIKRAADRLRETGKDRPPGPAGYPITSITISLPANPDANLKAIKLPNAPSDTGAAVRIPVRLPRGTKEILVTATIFDRWGNR